MIQAILEWLPQHLIVLGTLMGLVAGMGTGVGALGIFFWRTLSPKLEDLLLSVAAGIMLAASFFSLIIPGLDEAAARWSNPGISAGIVSFGVLAGALVIWSIHHFVPHEHFQTGREGLDAGKLRRIWLFVIAITLHNFPEGMAVGVGFAAGPIGSGLPLAAGIFLQNLPEGLAVAASLMTLKYKRAFAYWMAFLTGLVEPLGAFFGSAAVWFASPMMPWTLGFAAGAMLFIISDEIIPETHARGNKTIATFGLLAGLLVMLCLDVVIG